MDWRPQGLTGCDADILTVVSLNWSVNLGFRGCTGHTVQIPSNAGADTEVGGSQKNPLIWEGLESARGHKRKEFWVRMGAGACVGAGEKAKPPRLADAHGSPPMPTKPPHPSPSSANTYSASSSQNHFSKM